MAARARADRPTVGWVWRAYAAMAVGLRYLIVLAWVAAALAATRYLPQLSSSGSVAALIPKGAPAVRAEYQATRLFGLPLSSQVEVVQRDPRGFSPQAQLRAVSLGSDYNVFVVGRIWEEARRRPLRDAVAVAVPRASRTITTAGLALAAGFGLLALVPLAQFREIAVAMVLGIVIDTFVVRSLLVPALVVLFGRAGRWPGGRRGPAGPPHAGAPGPVTPEASRTGR
jgi:uncharacterized membrane protein YdfJ with MMPL/SSD domain